jgi:hypothetical protein
MSSESPDPDPSPDSYRQIQDEHTRLKEVLEQISHTTDLQILVPLLQDLRTILLGHFRHEEQDGGLHSAVSEPHPHLRDQVDGVLGEHRTLLDSLDSILGTAREVLEVTTPNILLDVANMTRKLRDHDIRETELLTDAKYIDLGDKD